MNPKTIKALTEASRLIGEGRKDRALAHLEARIEHVKSTPIGLTLLGLLLAEAGRHGEALERIERALKLDPAYVEAYRQQTRSLGAVGRDQDALAAAEVGLRLAPGDPDLLLQKAVSLQELKRLDEAADTYATALQLHPANPHLLAGLGLLLLRLDRPAEALNALDHAEQHAGAAPGYDGAAIARNRAAALEALGRDEEALAAIETARATGRGDPQIELSRALLLLALGRWQEGWAAYEVRDMSAARGDVATIESLRAHLRANGFTVPEIGNDPLARTPVWTPDAPEGSTLIVTAEQGLGDVLQMARYLPILAARAKVTMRAPKPLHRFLATVDAPIEFVDRIEKGRRFDRKLAMFSIPRVLGTTPETVPATVPYLRADPERVTAWRDRLGPEGFKVVIAWQGNPLGTIDRGRSVPLATFAPIAAIPGVRLISVQKTYGLDQLDRLPEGMRVETLDSEFDGGEDAFLDTAAVMAASDLVVTTDTSVVHVAGATGRPTCVALKFQPDWRWRLGGDTSPWYPTVTPVRQSRPGAWEDVFERIAARIAAWTAAA